MDSKRDIYNLWVQYTTKNDESYFREFIERFVMIWKSQLDLDFSKTIPLWHEVKSDSGPHLGRLPEELLPAIGKFIIVSRDESEKHALTNEAISQIAVLIDCLIIICRHFDNILAVIKYEYKSNLIAILDNVFKETIARKCASNEVFHLFRSFSQFLEVMYDPYLTWRSFLRGQFADFILLSYKPHAVHVEIVPFIYDCFQNENILNFAAIGESLLHVFGAVISGSQKALTSVKTKASNHGEGIEICDHLRNGMRAICPATVSVIMNILSQWESYSELRKVALKCCALMVIVSQRSSPEERQIELTTIIQLYCDVLEKLLNTDNFSEKTDAFQISSDGNNVIIDVNALFSTISNVDVFLSDPRNASHICLAINETQLIDILIEIPSRIQHGNINHSPLLCSTIKSLGLIARKSVKTADKYPVSDKTEKIFRGLREFGAPSKDLLEVCFALAYDEKAEILIIPEVLIKLIDWLPDIAEQEQSFISALILKGCTSNYATKSTACDNRTIKALCECLQKYQNLSELCIQSCIKFIEELSKISITPIELKRLLGLLRKENAFPYCKQLLQTIVTVSLQNLTSGNLCSQYFDLTHEDDGILVPDIKNWTMSGSYGFIFHTLVRLQENPGKSNVSATDHAQSADNSNKRRMLLNLRTGSNTGFEIFLQSGGNLVVAALTKREYLTSSVATKTLFDGQWHFVTVAITPPKRPFSYSQINVFVDCMQKISATLKFQAINEPFTFCSVGSAALPDKTHESAAAAATSLTRSSSHETSSYKGMLPSLLERTLSTNVSNYFTLPLRTQTSFDPNVKNFPIGMQDTVFGEPSCLFGQLGAVLLAEPTTNLKTIFDAGIHFSSIFSQDNDLLELTSRFVLCYAPGSQSGESCQDLIPIGRYPATIKAKHCRIVKMQDTISSIGGIQAILPILHKITKEQVDFPFSCEESNEGLSLSGGAEQLKTTTADEFSDWEMLSSNSYTEWKMIQYRVANFLCFLRYLTHDHENNQENLLNSECLSMVGMMLQKCSGRLFDVNALMATHLFVESIQGQKTGGYGNANLLDTLYAEICFNFNIWSKMNFQITLGHVQYLSTMIKNDRKYFRKKFGIQYFLDVIRQYYGTPDNISADDAKTLRSTLFAIVRFNLQKDVNIKEISAIIAFLASVKHEHILIEFLEMMSFHMKGKNCKDQMILLLHEPQTANLMYNFFIDKSYNTEVQEAAIRFITCLLATSRVHHKYKQILRLNDPTTNISMFPGLFSYMIPMTLSSTILFHLVDEILSAEADYSGLIFLLHHISSCDLPIKLEIAKRLLQTTFVKQNSPQAIAKQVGWQESIARLLIRKPLTNVKPDEGKRKSFGISLDVLLEDNADFFSQTDLINFCEQEVEFDQLQHEHQNDGGLILNEIQASVTEAANVLESEIKELAESVSGAVVENVSSVFSVIRQRTHDIQDTFESLTLGSSSDADNTLARQRTESISSDSSAQSPNTFMKKDNFSVENAFEFNSDADVDSEEQLVYLVSNILFTILWRGVSNDHPECWKERGQVLGCINLLALNNELVTSHLLLRLRILEMAVQASLFDLSEHGNQTLINQENASQILRMVYDLVVLGSNEDESKKCSTKLLDGVLALLDALMIFQQGSSDDWSDMIRLCLGLLLKCSHHPNPGVVAMATAKLHAILQSRSTEDPPELAFLLFSIHKSLDIAIEVGNPEEYSFLMPVMKALLEKCRYVFNLDSNLPDLPPTSSGPVFFNDFQMYSTSKKWRSFIERMIKPLYDTYQREIELNLWEPINRFWAECYEACKAASKKRGSLQAETRRVFQQKIVMPWKVRQVEEMTRLNTIALQQKTKNSFIKKKWKTAKRFLYGPRGPWATGKLTLYQVADYLRQLEAEDSDYEDEQNTHSYNVFMQPPDVEYDSGGDDANEDVGDVQLNQLHFNQFNQLIDMDLPVLEGESYIDNYQEMADEKPSTSAAAASSTIRTPKSFCTRNGHTLRSTLIFPVRKVAQLCQRNSNTTDKELN